MSVIEYNGNACQITFYSGVDPILAVCSIRLSHDDPDLIKLRTFLRSNHALNHNDM